MGLIPAQKNIEWKIVRTAYNYPSAAEAADQFVWLRRAVVDENDAVVEIIGEEQCVGFSAEKYDAFVTSTSFASTPRATDTAADVARDNLRCMYAFLGWLFTNGELEVK